MSTTVPLNLQRRTIALDPTRGLDGVVEALDAVTVQTGDDATTTMSAVAVNILSTGHTPLLFCRANVAAVLSAGVSGMTVDLAPLDRYSMFARSTVDAAIGLVHNCRSRLRAVPLSACGPPLMELRQRLDLIILMVDGCAWQRRDQVLADAGQRVSTCSCALVDSIGQADNVRCMDDLYYDLLPAMAAVVAALPR